MAKMKAWRAASRKNTIEGELTQRQFRAQVRQFKDKYPSGLLWGMLTRMGIVNEFYHANQGA